MLPRILTPHWIEITVELYHPPSTLSPNLLTLLLQSSYAKMAVNFSTVCLHRGMFPRPDFRVLSCSWPVGRLLLITSPIGILLCHFC